MVLGTAWLLSVPLTAVAMAAGFAHLLALPNKLPLSRDDYFTDQPDNWDELRRQWEYSHAAGAGLYFVALTALTLPLLVGRRWRTTARVPVADHASPAGTSSPPSVYAGGT